MLRYFLDLSKILSVMIFDSLFAFNVHPQGILKKMNIYNKLK